MSKLLSFVLCSSLCAAPLAGQATLFEFTGPTLSNFGAALDVMGDVDGDGVAEIVIGAHEADGALVDCGTVTVVSGATGATLVVLSGPSSGSWFGKSVAGLDDVDGDGIGDLAVSAPRATSAGGSFSGVVRVYSGATWSVLHSSHGTSPGSWWARSLNRLGDLDGDGADDILVSSEDEPTQNTGRVTVFSGATGAVLRSWDAAPGDTFGLTSAPAGDLDADGKPDVLIHATQVGGVFGAQELRAYSGATGALLHAWPDVEVAQNAALSGGDGPPCATLGDVDGDGHDDIVTNDRDGPGPLPNDHVARVYSGATGAELLLLTPTDPNNAPAFAIAVAGTGDVDGDGVPDMVIGSPLNGAFPAQAEFRSGADGSVISTIAGASDSPRFGSPIAAADIDGDGVREVLVGQPSPAIGGGAVPGRAFVFAPSCDGAVVTSGVGLAGTGGIVPTLDTTGCPAPGASLTLAIANARGGASAWWLVAATPASLPFKGGTLLVLPSAALIVPLTLGGAPGVAGAGGASLPLAIPADPLFAGLDAHTQLLVSDPGAGAGFALSPALVLEIR